MLCPRRFREAMSFEALDPRRCPHEAKPRSTRWLCRCASANGCCHVVVFSGFWPAQEDRSGAHALGVAVTLSPGDCDIGGLRDEFALGFAGGFAGYVRDLVDQSGPAA